MRFRSSWTWGFFIIVASFLPQIFAQTNEVDQAALVSLWNAITNQEALEWNTTTSLCGQSGITCANGKVTFLNWSERQLVGSLPTEIGQLTSLTLCHLPRNKLSGTIPTEFGYLTSLRSLAIDINEFTGTIPTELKIPTLQLLHLSVCPSLCYGINYGTWAPSNDYFLVENCQNCGNPCGSSAKCLNGPTDYICEAFCPGGNAYGVAWPYTAVNTSTLVVGDCLPNYAPFDGTFPTASRKPQRKCVVLETEAGLSSTHWEAPDVSCEVTCPTEPCQHGGTCFFGYCACADSRFSGKYCEQVSCENINCLNGGVCDQVGCDCTGTGYIGSSCDILLVAVVALPIAIVVTFAVYFLLRRFYPKAKNTVVLSVTLTLYDFVTDCVFMYSQSKSERTYPFFIASLVFLVVPVLFNLIAVGKILVSSIFGSSEMEAWVKRNPVTATSVVVLASTNIEMFALIHSGLFNQDSFLAPLDEKALKTIAVAGMIGNFLEDIPQLVIQSIAASETLDTITFLSIVASVLTIVFGMLKRGLLFLVRWSGASKKLYQSQVNVGGDEGEGKMSTLYSEFPEERSFS